jgi:hypothetical protein
LLVGCIKLGRTFTETVIFRVTGSEPPVGFRIEPIDVTAHVEVAGLNEPPQVTEPLS